MTPTCVCDSARACKGRHRAAPTTAPRHYTAPLLARLVEPERPKTGGLEGTYITPRSVRAHVHTPGVTGSKRGGSLESVTLCASAGWPTARPACPHLHGRGFCPSCGGGRMADTAAHLVDRVLPEVPARRWVLSFAFQSVQDSNLHAGNISPLIPGTYVDHGPSSDRLQRSVLASPLGISTCRALARERRRRSAAHSDFDRPLRRRSWRSCHRLRREPSGYVLHLKRAKWANRATDA